MQALAVLGGPLIRHRIPHVGGVVPDTEVDVGSQARLQIKAARPVEVTVSVGRSRAAFAPSPSSASDPTIAFGGCERSVDGPHESLIEVARFVALRLPRACVRGTRERGIVKHGEYRSRGMVDQRDAWLVVAEVDLETRDGGAVVDGWGDGVRHEGGLHLWFTLQSKRAKRVLLTTHLSDIDALMRVLERLDLEDKAVEVPL